MALKVLGARVMIKVDEAQSTEGGILLPETAREKPQWGTVVSVGEFRLEDGSTRPLDVKEGDRVVFAKYGGREISEGGEDYMIFEVDQIYAKLA